MGFKNVRWDSQTDLIDKVLTQPHVVNVWLDYGELVGALWSQYLQAPEHFGFIPSENIAKVAVEHTSLNTVFPINVATFRGSVIGDAVKKFLQHQLHVVNSHFYVEDLSRRNHVLLTAMDAIGWDQLNGLEGKPDHELGYLYTTTVQLLKHEGYDSDIINSMFPRAISRLHPGSCQEIAEFDWRSYVFDRRYTFMRDSCIVGFEQTLRQCGVQIDIYDFEADWIFKYLPRDKPNDETYPTYVDRNVWYFRRLLQEYDRVISIVPINMTLQPAADVASVSRQVLERLCDHTSPEGTEIQVEIHPYGDVGIVRGNNKAYRDSIARGTFTCLDSFLDFNSRASGLDYGDVSNALRIALLGCRNSANITVNFDVAELNVYLNAVRVLERAIGWLEGAPKRLISSNKGMWGTNDMVLARSLLRMEIATQEQTNVIPEFGKMTKFLFDLSNQLDRAVLVNEREYNHLARMELITLAVAAILNCMLALGLDSSAPSIHKIAAYLTAQLN